MSLLHPAVFLDRDGVILVNREDYVKTWEEVKFLPRAFDALARLTVAELPIVIVTNQSAVGRGILSLDAALDLQCRIVAEIEMHGGRVQASYLCPHNPQVRCVCRKPAPGMLYQAADDHLFDLSASYMVGDALTDVEAGEAAGTSPILVLTGRGRKEAERVPPRLCAGLPIVADLSAAADYILMQQRV